MSGPRGGIVSRQEGQPKSGLEKYSLSLLTWWAVGEVREDAGDAEQCFDSVQVLVLKTWI